MAKININLKDGSIQKRHITVGIDLGTTNSLIAHIDGEGNPYVIKDEDGRYALVPSILYLDEAGFSVGHEAKEQMILDQENAVYSVKRLLGKSFEDLKEFQQKLGYSILDQEDALVKVRIKDKYYSPIELSAEILKALKSRAEKVLNVHVDKAVITVPAYFNDAQRQATRDAGRLAGMDVLRIINEPTAASLAYGIGLSKNEEKTIAVYDLGGGTFDISILEIADGVFEVLSTNGDTFLGGDDLDMAIVEYWRGKMELNKDIFYNDKKQLQEIRLLAEKAKVILSNDKHFDAEFRGYHLSLNRGQFETLIQPFVEKTILRSKQALKDAGLKATDIDQIIMVGGSTRIPYIKSTVSAFFGKKVNDSLNPDEVVALGAAIQADILSGNNKDMLLLDITPLSLGIETVGGLMDVLIPRNSKIPTKVGRNYTTSIDGQVNLKVSVYQGERDLVSDNRKLGEFVLKGIPPMPAGIPKVEIQFILDADGILIVKASELRSQTETEVEIKSTYGISEEEMSKMLIDSIKNAVGDMKIRVLLEARTEASNLVMSGNKFLNQHKEILSIEEYDTTKILLADLEANISGDSKDDINKAMERLNDYTQPLAERAMDSAIGRALKGTRV